MEYAKRVHEGVDVLELALHVKTSCGVDYIFAQYGRKLTKKVDEFMKWREKGNGHR
jgi:hypothetical protein